MNNPPKSPNPNTETVEDSSTWQITIISNSQSQESSQTGHKTPETKKVIIKKSKQSTKDHPNLINRKKSPIKILQKITPKLYKQSILSSNKSPRTRITSPRIKGMPLFLNRRESNEKNNTKKEDFLKMENKIKKIKEKFFGGKIEKSEKDKIIGKLLGFLDQRLTLINQMQDKISTLNVSKRLFDGSSVKKKSKMGKQHFLRETYKSKIHSIFDESSGQNQSIFQTQQFMPKKKHQTSKKNHSYRKRRSTSNPVNIAALEIKNQKVLNKYVRKTHNSEIPDFLLKKLKIEKTKDLNPRIENLLKFEKLINAFSKLAEQLNFGFGKFKADEFKRTPRMLWKWIKQFFNEFMEIKQRDINYKILIDSLKKANLNFDFSSFNDKKNIDKFVKKIIVEKRLKIQELEILEKKVRKFFGVKDEDGVRKIILEMEKRQLGGQSRG